MPILRFEAATALSSDRYKRRYAWARCLTRVATARCAPLRQRNLFHRNPLPKFALLVGLDLRGIRTDHGLDRLGLGQHADNECVVCIADADVLDAQYRRAFRALLRLALPGTLHDRGGTKARRRVVALQYLRREFGEARVGLDDRDIRR